MRSTPSPEDASVHSSPGPQVSLPISIAAAGSASSRANDARAVSDTAPSAAAKAYRSMSEPAPANPLARDPPSATARTPGTSSSAFAMRLATS